MATLKPTADQDTAGFIDAQNAYEKLFDFAEEIIDMEYQVRVNRSTFLPLPEGFFIPMRTDPATQDERVLAVYQNGIELQRGTDWDELDDTITASQMSDGKFRKIDSGFCWAVKLLNGRTTDTSATYRIRFRQRILLNAVPDIRLIRYDKSGYPDYTADIIWRDRWAGVGATYAPQPDKDACNAIAWGRPRDSRFKISIWRKTLRNGGYYAYASGHRLLYRQGRMLRPWKLVDASDGVFDMNSVVYGSNGRPLRVRTLDPVTGAVSPFAAGVIIGNGNIANLTYRLEWV